MGAGYAIILYASIKGGKMRKKDIYNPKVLQEIKDLHEIQFIIYEGIKYPINHCAWMASQGYYPDGTPHNG